MGDNTKNVGRFKERRYTQRKRKERHTDTKTYKYLKEE